MKAPLRKVPLENIPVHPEMTKSTLRDSALEENPSFSLRATSHRRPAIRRDIAALFKLFDADENTRSAILIDLYFNTLAATKVNTESPPRGWRSSRLAREGDGELQTIGNCPEFFKLLMLQSTCTGRRMLRHIHLRRDKEMNYYMLSTYFRHQAVPVRVRSW